MTILYSNTTYGSGVIVDLGLSDSLVVTRNSDLFSNDNFAVKTSGTGQTIQVFGFIGGSAGIWLNNVDTITGNTIDIAAGGIVGTTGTAISVRLPASKIINSGEVRSSDSIAISLGVSPDRSLGTIYNYGVISGQFGGINVLTGGKLTVYNYGTIAAMFSYAIIADAGNDLLVNRGTIEGRVNLWTGDDTLRNRGQINGDVDMQAGNDLLDNVGGTIDGTIAMGDGSDTLRPGAAGGEDANGGDGLDTLDFSRLGSVVVALDGSRDNAGAAAGDTFTAFENLTGSKLGSDILIGDAGTNLLVGLGGADKLYGRDGDDALDGGRGADLLDGGAGDDELDGGEDNDSLSGGAGADTLLGQAGNDVLKGGDGNDTLNGGDGADKLNGGGTGQDMLTGGVGADQFIFYAGDVAGTTVAGANFDKIADFSRAELDKIVLSAIDANTTVTGNQAFAFIGTAAFHNVAGELRISAVSGGYNVLGDTNGDGVADLVIGVTTGAALVASDFVL